jgi:hypothetical protein
MSWAIGRNVHTRVAQALNQFEVPLFRALSPILYPRLLQAPPSPPPAVDGDATGDRWQGNGLWLSRGRGRLSMHIIGYSAARANPDGNMTMAGAVLLDKLETQCQR